MKHFLENNVFLIKRDFFKIIYTVLLIILFMILQQLWFDITGSSAGGKNNNKRWYGLYHRFIYFLYFEIVLIRLPASYNINYNK